MSPTQASRPRPRGWRPHPYHAASAVALLTAFLLIWINGAVGILGSENNPLNLVYAAVLVAAVVGSLVAGFEARGMAKAMQAAAAAQVLVGVVVLAFGYFTPLVTAVFAGLWLLSAGLYRKAVDGGPMLPPLRSDAGMRFWRHLRWLVWGGAGVLLLLPAIAMRFTDEVGWSAFDFLVMGALLFALCLSFELAVRVARHHAHIMAAGIAVAASFLAVWINLAVGIIGSERNPVNAIFLAVPAIALAGTIWAQLQPARMVRAMQIAAGAQAITVVVTVLLGEGLTFLLPLGFVAMWLAAAQLFRHAPLEGR